MTDEELIAKFQARVAAGEIDLRPFGELIFGKFDQDWPARLIALARRGAAVRLASTNTAEGFFGNSKRSIDGTHHQVSRKYLPFYLAELDFKYNTRKMTDGARTADAIPKIVGKRLMLRRPKGEE